MSSFEFEFSCRVLKSILEFDFSNSRSRTLKSNFEFVFFVSLLYSTSRNRSSNSTSRISLLYSTSRFKFLEFRIRLFRCLALVDFSNVVALVDFSNFEFRVKCLEFRIRLDLFDFSNFDSNLSSKVSLLYSTSRSRISSLSS